MPCTSIINKIHGDWEILSIINLNKLRKNSLREQSLHQRSKLRWTQEPSPTINLISSEKVFHTPLILSKDPQLPPLSNSLVSPYLQKWNIFKDVHSQLQTSTTISLKGLDKSTQFSNPQSFPLHWWTCLTPNSLDGI